MSDKATKPPPAATRRPPEPRDVVDGIPDRSPNAAAWKLLVLGGVFLAWIGFLIYCRIAG